MMAITYFVVIGMRRFFPYREENITLFYLIVYASIYMYVRVILIIIIIFSFPNPLLDIGLSKGMPLTLIFSFSFYHFSDVITPPTW